MSTNGRDIRQDDFIALRPTGLKVSTPHLLISAAGRLVRRPVAALVGLIATGSFGFALSKALQLFDWSTAVAIFTSSIAGFVLLLCLTALSVMRHSELDHLRYLSGVGITITIVCGTVVGLAAALLLGVGPAEHMLGLREHWLAHWFVYVLAPLSAMMIAAAFPSLILAWSVMARYQTRFWETIQFVWARSEDRPNHWFGFTAGISLTCAALAFVPVVGLLIPAFLAQCFAQLLEFSVTQSELCK